ncbi:hypothetical protein [Tautonia plasticadhaerens]|uniref:Uncharacterized protein n=1 Tax=Tautonia plasticadhaerens TaxID=2527974 RepID=A0A518HAA9_9BACT|nr:hypothetical protein [Tautonia plasticadhaerens]QDV37790.1 hypothetical protein ElP_57360 [Tautonia plasticadhaerens]
MPQHDSQGSAGQPEHGGRGPAPRRGGPRFDREVAYHERTFVFSRFDSRGGSVLLLAPDTPTALRRYERALGLDPSWDAAYDDIRAGGRVGLLVCDRPLPEGDGELLAGYADEGPGYLLARVEARLLPNRAGDLSGPWAEFDLAVLWCEADEDGDAPVDPSPAGGAEEARAIRNAPAILPDLGPSVLRYEYRLRPWEVGEDCYGLVLIRDAERLGPVGNDS